MPPPVGAGWAPDYITAADIAAYLRVDDTDDDELFALWATASSRAVDRRTNRQFGKVAAAETRTYRRPAYYSPQYGVWIVEIDDLRDLTGFTVNGVAYASSGATLLPDNAAFTAYPYTALAFTDQPTAPLDAHGLWGWDGIPAQVLGACRLQSARWNFRRDAPAGVAGSPESGSEVRLLSRLDPDVATMLTGLSRRRRPG